jgi:DHA1 family multidrug resistance protein-like MFS transporter
VELWRRNQIAVTAASFVGFTGFTLVMPFLARYMQEMGVTDTGDVALWTGITLGVTPAVSALVSPLWGRVGDRFGNKVLVQRSLFSSVVMMVLMARASQPWQLFALRAMQGFVAGYGPLTMTMATQLAPRDQVARVIGAVQTAQRIGPAIGPAIGGVLAAAVGLRSTFLVSAAIYGLAFVLLTAMYSEPPPAVRHHQAAERVSFGNVLAFENFLLLMLVIFLLQLVDRSFGPVLLLHLTQIGYRTEGAALFAGVLFSTLAIAAVVGHQLAAWLLERGTARAVIVTAALVASASMTVFAVAGATWLLLVSIAVFGVTIGSAMTTSFTAAHSVIPKHAHGVSFGFLTGASLFGSAISPMLSGLIGSHSIRFVFLADAAVLAILVLLVRRVMVERDLAIESAPAVDET